MEEIENEEKRGPVQRFLEKFRKNEDEEEQIRYKRRLLDGRIERYLDNNMDAYIEEYGMVTGLDLESMEQRYQGLTGRISDMNSYMLDADALISGMELDLKEIKKNARKK